MLRLLSACFAGMLCLAASGAVAQIVGPPPPGENGLPDHGVQSDAANAQYRLDLRKADRTIREGRQSGRLSRKEAKGLRKEGRMIDTMTARYASDGLSESEARELDIRARALESLAGSPGGGRR